MRGDTGQGTLAEDRNDAHVSARYWMNTRPDASGTGSGGSTISLGGASPATAISGDAPRIAFALPSKAPAAGKAEAVTAGISRVADESFAFTVRSA